MFDDEENIEVSLNVETFSTIKFSADFSALAIEGERLDTSELGLLLSTVVRMASTSSDELACGEIRRVCSWAPSSGFLLDFDGEESRVYRLKGGVTCWNEMSDSFPSLDSVGALCHALPSFKEIVESLKSDSAVSWMGLRAHHTGEWLHEFKAMESKAGAIQKVIMTCLQMDVLLKTQQYPRGRISISMANGKLWIWANRDDDYLMVFTPMGVSAEGIARILHYGEQFMVAE